MGGGRMTALGHKLSLRSEPPMARMGSEADWQLLGQGRRKQTSSTRESPTAKRWVLSKKEHIEPAI